MLGPFLKGQEWVKSNTPKVSMPKLSKLRVPSLLHFNFIIWHYVYIVGMTVICSILLYPAGGLAYIDALFLGGATTTQSGLNTVNLNSLNTYQQVVIFFVGCITNIISVNIFVVFVRLYWFEKHLRKVVKEARNFRRFRSRSRINTEGKDMDLDREENGVGERDVVMLRSNGQTSGYTVENRGNGGTELNLGDDSVAIFTKEAEENVRATDNPGDELAAHHASNTDERRVITFADGHQPPRQRIGNEDRIPRQRTKEEHIAFVENQRNPQGPGPLRIPGPRDFDRGDMPTRVDESQEQSEEESEALSETGSHVVRNGYHTESQNNKPATSEIQRTPREANGDENVRTTEPATVDRQREVNWDDDALKSDGITDGQDQPRRKLREGPANFDRGKSTTESSAGLRQRRFSRTFSGFLPSRSQERSQERGPMPYLSYAATIGRNSTFVDLTEPQREELGGIEYRSLRTLAFVLLTYYVGFLLLAIIILIPWIVRDSTYRSVLAGDGQNGVWWAIFTPASAINNLGLTITPDSMVSFQQAALPLLVFGFLIVIGNTGFPCMLRFIIWIASKCARYGSAISEEYRFLLDHPRRCFTLLFPSKPTWWLLLVLVILNGIDLILFIILNLGDSTVTALPPGYQFLDGLFQALSTRTAGFAAVNIAALHPAIQVSYLIMMYISVFPLAISVRRTNVYEERSLGIYAEGGEDEGGTEPSYVGAHLRRQLSFDLWYIFLGLFFIAIIEGGRLQSVSDYAFNLFAILFEVVSAYGTVGLSLGYPNIDPSFSAEFHTLSKLIMVALMIRGRHRGLPYALDKAILLPSDSHEKEEREAEMRAKRQTSDPTRLSTAGSRQDSNISQTPRGHGHHLRRMVTGVLSAGPNNRS